jgi:cysteine synthase
MVVRLAREDGILIGPSSGANLVAAMNIAEKAKAAGQLDALIVTIFADSAAKYFSDRWWQEVQSEAENWP